MVPLVSSRQTVDYSVTGRFLEKPEFATDVSPEELEDFSAAVIPLRITGPLADPSIRPDMEALLRDRCRGRSEETDLRQAARWRRGRSGRRRAEEAAEGDGTRGRKRHRRPVEGRGDEAAEGSLRRLEDRRYAQTLDTLHCSYPRSPERRTCGMSPSTRLTGNTSCAPKSGSTSVSSRSTAYSSTGTCRPSSRASWSNPATSQPGEDGRPRFYNRNQACHAVLLQIVRALRLRVV